MSTEKFVLQLADNALIYSQRLSEWCGHGPALEIDIALSNIALDHLGAARSFYQYAATIIGNGATEDSLAYLRKEREYSNIKMVELPNEDFAITMAKAFYLDAFLQLYYAAMQQSTDEQLAAIATKSLKEVNYHYKFSSEWIIRMGDGTPESKMRIQKALDEMWGYTGEMFLASKAELACQTKGIAIEAKKLHEAWLQKVNTILEEATLKLPEATFMHSGGKEGLHTEHLGFILAEMQYMQRAYPGMDW
jgi:ring-1,2-phenylacetyl-CoA epoxidase subunit PaaC